MVTLREKLTSSKASAVQASDAQVLPSGQAQFDFVKGWGVPLRHSARLPYPRGQRAIDKVEARLRALSKYTCALMQERLVNRLIGRQVLVDEQIGKLASGTR